MTISYNPHFAQLPLALHLLPTLALLHHQPAPLCNMFTCVCHCHPWHCPSVHAYRYLWHHPGSMLAASYHQAPYPWPCTWFTLSCDVPCWPHQQSHAYDLCLGPCPWPCLPRTHDTLLLHLWHMHDVIMHHALRPGTPAAPWCHHHIITMSFAPHNVIRSTQCHSLHTISLAPHNIIHDTFLCHDNSAAALPYYDIIAPLWRHQWLHNDTLPSLSSIRLCPWYHAPGPVPQISDPMTLYIMLMNYDSVLFYL